MAMCKDASKTCCKAIFGNNNGLAVRSFITATQVYAKNGKSVKAKEKKDAKVKKEMPEIPLIPQSQQEYDKFINIYRNEEFFKYGGYSYYDIETDLLQHRQPQPKKPALY